MIYLLHEEEIFYKREPKLWDKLSQLGNVSSLPTSTGVDIHIKVNAEDFDNTVLEVKKIMGETTIEKHIWQ